jgi:hypothetical protein
LAQVAHLLNHHVVAKQPAEEEDPPRWALLSVEAYSQAWNVPWGARTVVGGMTLWATSFLVVGVVLLPLIGYSFGIKVCPHVCFHPIANGNRIAASNFELFNISC